MIHLKSYAKGVMREVASIYIDTASSSYMFERLGQLAEAYGDGYTSFHAG